MTAQSLPVSRVKSCRKTAAESSGFAGRGRRETALGPRAGHVTPWGALRCAPAAGGGGGGGGGRGGRGGRGAEFGCVG